MGKVHWKDCNSHGRILTEMANPTGKGGKRFQKGKSGNPGGRPKNTAIQQFKQTTYADFINSLQKYGTLSRTEMAIELQRPDATMFEIMFGQIVASAAKGDKEARSVLLERLWGKVKEIHRHELPEDIAREKIKSMSTKELIDLIKDQVE